MADGSLFAKPWKPPTRENYRRVCLLLRLRRMEHRAPRPTVEGGRAFARWHRRIQQLQAIARTMGGFRG